MTGNIEDALLFALAQEGDEYVFGSEDGGAGDDQWDCSELVEVSCRQAGITPVVPDGAYYQWKHSTPITVAEGMDTRGALLFVGDGTGVGRDAITHVAWSLGDGTTIEARGRRWGVGVWPAAGRFDFAGLVPGASYIAPPPFPVPPPKEVDDMTTKELIAALNAAATAGQLDPFFKRQRQIIETGKVEDILAIVKATDAKIK